MEKQKQNKKNFIPYEAIDFGEAEMLERSEQFFQYMDRRRSLRFFSSKEVPLQLIENLIKTASTAPSGAHKQPWTFCVIQDKSIKKAIREAAEKEEYENYHGRMSDEWLEDLEKFDTDWHKEFLEVAPYLIVIFKKTYDVEEGDKKKNYYVNESVGLAAGFLLTAIHNAGLVALTHTPSPMNFLAEILKRPQNEKPFLLIPIGYPSDNAVVPDLKRKALDEIMKLY
ncbi:MAG: nitroreductase family protein [Flavobacteriales bacterium]|nr:nitroreductase family protein [Flavobacteriales bacterium]|tara:strand:- start:909 stop:1586 length:678 start_codon:yes stop_codon:yes gene_type:complete